MVKSILLTGHTGFLGSVIYKSLVKEFVVYTLGRSEDSDYRVDFLNWDGRLELKHSIDAIVHVAGLAHGKSNSDSAMTKVNLESTKYLTDIADKCQISAFVFISSTAIYGREYGLEIREDEKLQLRTNFAQTKFQSENSILDRGNAKDSLIIRLPLVIGPNPIGNLGKLLASIQSSKHIFLKGNKARKSVVFASDVATFISNWLKYDEKKSGVVNLTSGKAPTFNWIENTIRQYTGSKFFFAFPVGLLWKTIVFLKHRIGISIPIFGKIFYPLTFSDQLARDEFNYQSKELNQTNFINELNSNH